MATNGAGATTSVPFTLTQDSAAPTGQSITYGGNASFTAAASGNPSPTVQWQVSTDSGTTWNNVSNGGIYSGATTTALLLTKPAVAQSGSATHVAARYRQAMSTAPGLLSRRLATRAAGFGKAPDGPRTNGRRGISSHPKGLSTA